MTRDEMVNKARSYVKSTAYPNPNDFTKWFFKDNLAHAWCGAFIDYVVKHDLGCDWLDSCSNFGYVPTIVSWGKSKGYWTTDYTKAQKGDLVIFDWTPETKGDYAHIGIVTSTTSSGVNSIDGNTNYGKYDKNCVANKTRNKQYVAGVVLLPYKESEDMPFKIGDYVYALEDIRLYTDVSHKESKYTLKKGQKAYVRYIQNNQVALANPDTKEYFVSAWTSQLDKLSLNPLEEDYKALYEQQLLINKDLKLQIENLQNKINEAIKVLS